LWRKEGKEIDLTLPGLPDLVGERALSHQRQDTGQLPNAEAHHSALKSKRLNPIRLQQMKDRCREIEEQVARLESAIEGHAQELAHFKSAADSVRLAQSIEQGREEVARLMREWEDTAIVVEEQEAEVRE
jgi:archaellum component FlaC